MHYNYNDSYGIPRRYKRKVPINRDATAKWLNLRESETGYECEHGSPCKPGGHTECPKCPYDSGRVKYRPSKRFYHHAGKSKERCMSQAMCLHYPLVVNEPPRA